MQDDEFRAFYLEHVHRLHSYVTKWFGDPSAADDIVQEAFLRVFSADLPCTMSSEHIENYLYKVATNLASMNARDRGLLWLAYVENLSHRDISAILGYGEKSVRTLLYRAKEKLIGILQGSEKR